MERSSGRNAGSERSAGVGVGEDCFRNRAEIEVIHRAGWYGAAFSGSMWRSSDAGGHGDIVWAQNILEDRAGVYGARRQPSQLRPGYRPNIQIQRGPQHSTHDRSGPRSNHASQTPDGRRQVRAGRPAGEEDDSHHQPRKTVSADVVEPALGSLGREPGESTCTSSCPRASTSTMRFRTVSLRSSPAICVRRSAAVAGAPPLKRR
jgi:hypothetical protein